MRDIQTMFNAVGGQGPITATARSTNSIDLADLLHNLGQTSQKIMLKVKCNVSFNNLTSLTIELDSAPDNSTWTSTMIVGTAVVLANLIAGNMLFIVDLGDYGKIQSPLPSAGYFEGMPPGPNPLQRYISMNYTVTGSAPTTGTIDAWLDVF